MPDISAESKQSIVQRFQSPIEREPHPLLSLRGWVIAIAILIGLGLILQLRALLMLTAFLTIWVGVSWAWNRFALNGVTYERHLSETHAFHNETVEITVHLANRKALPLSWLLTYDPWPEPLPVQTGGQLITTESTSYLVNSYSARWYQSISRRYTLLCKRRGVYAFGPVRVRTGDLFGLFRQQGGHEHLDQLVVYPKILPLEQIGLPPRDLFGEVRAQLKIFEDPARTIGVRDHHPGDGFRHVHWKATARSQRLQARVYEPTTSHTIVLMLNISTSKEYWQGAEPELLEQAITAAASIAYHLSHQRTAVGLVVNGTTPHSDQSLRVPPGRSPYQLMRVLEALAAVTGFATRSIEDTLLVESPRLPWGATLVVVTAHVSEHLITTLTRLRQAGRRLALIALTTQRPAAIPGVMTYHLKPVQIEYESHWLGKKKPAEGARQEITHLVPEPVSGQVEPLVGG